jgi:hypothetical protein
MRILVCGGRDYKNYEAIARAIEAALPPSNESVAGAWLPPMDTVLIHGGAPGADLLADKWAVTNWVKIEEFKADWGLHGKAAGPIRNQKMIDEGKPDVVVAFPGGRGTADMVRRARAAKIKVIEIEE